MADEMIQSDMFIADTILELRERMDHPEKYRGVKTGIAELDILLGGIGRPWYVAMCGQAKAGKTTGLSSFARSIVKASSDEGGTPHRCGWFGLEETEFQTGVRMLSAESKIKRNKFRDLTLTEAEMTILESITSSQIADWNMWFTFTAYSLEAVQATMLARKDIQFWFLDYLQLMHVERKLDSRTLEIGTISRTMKRLVNQLGCTIIAAVQLNSEDDPLWSKDIQRDCDVLLKIRNVKDPMDPDEVVANVIELEVAYSRHSAAGDKYELFFDGSTGTMGSKVRPSQSVPPVNFSGLPI